MALTDCLGLSGRGIPAEIEEAEIGDILCFWEPVDNVCLHYMVVDKVTQLPLGEYAKYQVDGYYIHMVELREKTLFFLNNSSTPWHIHPEEETEYLHGV